MIEPSQENYIEYLRHKSRKHRMIIIKGQTALGKTTAVGTAIKNASFIKSIIAVPTNPLKDQVFDDLVNMGITNIMKTPTLQAINDKTIEQHSNHLRDIGAFEKRKIYLQEQLEMLKNKEKTLLEKDLPIPTELDQDIRNIDTYLTQNEIANHFEGNIVTTWARAFHLHWCLQFTHKLIIDEDILKNNCIQVKTYTFKTLKNTLECLKNNYSSELKAKLDTIINAPYKTITPVVPIPRELITDKEREEIEAEIVTSKKRIYNIFDVLGIRAICKYNENSEMMVNGINDDDKIHCLICRQLPNMHTVVLSATLQEDFYRKYFHNKDIEYVEIPHDKYMGKILQDCSYTYSRKCLEEHPKLLETIRAKHKCLPIITFKKFKQDGEYNFGAVEGLNEIEGEDIVVVGFPYLNDVVYKFFLYALYGRIIDKDQKPRYRRVETDTHSFKITTYDDEMYKEIITYFVESEVEQAVGRARLLRNDCTVYLYSGFPAEQAEIDDRLIMHNETTEAEDETEIKNLDESVLDEKDL